MRRNRRLAPALPAVSRQPHPDASTEIRLQRIVSLRLAVARKEALLAEDQEQLAGLRQTVARHPNWDGHGKRQQQITTLPGEIGMLEEAVAGLHDDIAARAEGLSDVDLAYL